MRYSLAILCVFWLFSGATAMAQSRMSGGSASSYGTSSRSTSTGTFGSRSVGSGGIAAGQRTFSNNAGAGDQNSLEQLGSTAGQMTGSERFVRGNRDAGQFVGGDVADVAFIGAGSTGGTTSTGMGMGMGGGSYGMGAQGMGANASGRNQQAGGANGRGQQGRTQQTIRTTLRLGFTPTLASPQVATQRLTGMLQRSPQINWVTPIAVEIVGRTAVLRGTVATANERDLVQRVALLEPGISQVQNDLVVAALLDEPTPGAGPQ